jgi:WS/DGAT/MGAT family acyltransferase
MLIDELRRRVTLPLDIVRGAGARPSETWKGLTSTREALQGLRDAVASGFAPMHPTPFNVDIGPHRRIDWTRLDLDEVKEIRARAGGKVNDVVLAVVSGALQRFLKQRGVQIEGLEFRAAVPVSLRSEAERRGSIGNRVSGVLATLPLDESDPWRRLLRIVDMTRELKRSAQSAGGELLERLIELVPFRLIAGLERWGARHQAANIVITNVPGPAAPIYLLGAPMQASYPVVPLAPNLALGVALFSYDGGLYWGLNSDRDAVPDLHDFVEEISVQFEALRKAATTAGPSRPSEPPSEMARESV